MKIGVVAPADKEFQTVIFEALSAAARPDTEITLFAVDKGPASIESRYEKALATPYIVAKIVQAQKAGMDAVSHP